MPRSTVAALIALFCGSGCVQRTTAVAAGSDGGGAPTAVASGAPGTTSVSARRGEREGCRVTFSGAENSEFVGMWYPLRKDDRVTAASDYWATDSEARSALRGGMHEKDPAELKRKIDERMVRDPHVVILAVTCTGEAGGAVVIVSSENSKYADVPFAPGTYKLGTGTMQSAPAGDFAVARVRSSTTPYVDVEPGTLTVKKFDPTGVAGSFSFTATSSSTRAKAKIEGTFDLPCEPNRFGRCRIGG